MYCLSHKIVDGKEQKEGSSLCMHWSPGGLGEKMWVVDLTSHLPTLDLKATTNNGPLASSPSLINFSQ